VQNPINFLIDTTREIEAKQAVMAVYASQNSENNYPERWIKAGRYRCRQR